MHEVLPLQIRKKRLDNKTKLTPRVSAIHIALLIKVKEHPRTRPYTFLIRDEGIRSKVH